MVEFDDVETLSTWLSILVLFLFLFWFLFEDFKYSTITEILSISVLLIKSCLDSAAFIRSQSKTIDQSHQLIRYSYL